jgi:hypothetical protein
MAKKIARIGLRWFKMELLKLKEGGREREVEYGEIWRRVKW